MARRTFVIGVGMTKFSKPGMGLDYPEMCKTAGTRALNDACITYSAVEQV
jgi:hypothetical protein